MIVFVAVPDASSVTVASSVPPSDTATVPVGVPKPAAPVAVTVNVTASPYVDGFRLDVREIVAAVLVMTCVTTGDPADE